MIDGGKGMALGKNIAAERKKQGFSQEDIAMLVGVSRQAVSKWEKGLSNPSTENIIRLAEILKVSVEELTDGRQTGTKRVEENWNRIIYRVSDGRYKKLLCKDKIWRRLLNPVLLFLYLEIWQVMYEVAFVGMLSKNIPLFILYFCGILIFVIEWILSVTRTYKKRVLQGGETIEFAEDGMVVIDMSCHKIADIHYREIRKIKQNGKYWFLYLEEGRFLPIYQDDISAELKEVLKSKVQKINTTRWHLPVLIAWGFITFAGVFAVGQCAVNLNGALSWKIEELKTSKKVRLKETNFYELGFHGIIELAGTKVDYMPHLMARNVDIIYKPDGEIESIYAYIWGYDGNYKLRTSYLIYYDVEKSPKMVIDLQEWEGIDKSEQQEYDVNNDMDILLGMSENLDVKRYTPRRDEERYGFYYKGIQSWNYLKGMYSGHLHYMDQYGKIEIPEMMGIEDISGPTVSLYCPDSADEYAVNRFIYREGAYHE